jgi:hypothetical protein
MFGLNNDKQDKQSVKIENIFKNTIMNQKPFESAFTSKKGNNQEQNIFSGYPSFFSKVNINVNDKDKSFFNNKNISDNKSTENISTVDANNINKDGNLSLGINNNNPFSNFFSRNENNMKNLNNKKFIENNDKQFHDMNVNIINNKSNFPQSGFNQKINNNNSNKNNMNILNFSFSGINNGNEEDKNNKQTDFNKLNKINIINIADNNSNNINDKNNEEKEEVFQFSDCSELREYEKNSMLNKTNIEIIEELKDMLFSQKEKYNKCAENTRKIQNKINNMIKENKEASKTMENNEKKSIELYERINNLDKQSQNLKNEISKRNNNVKDALTQFKKYTMNNNYLFDQSNFDKFNYFEDMIDISKKCSIIENDLNYTKDNLDKKRKKIASYKSSDNNGIWIERDSKEIYVSQYEMNSLLNECYEQLTNLKQMQDSFNSKYELLKQTLTKDNKISIH